MSRGEDQVVVSFGLRLRAARAAQGRTLASVALDAGLSLPYVANLERGRGNPTLSVITALAAALDVSVVDLLGDAGTSTSNPPPAAVTSFVKSAAFASDAKWLAAQLGTDTRTVREALTAVLEVATARAPRPLDDLAYRRIVDALLLAYGRS